MSDQELFTERFTADEKAGKTISDPQCIGCRFNGGGMRCDALTAKPSDFLMNLETCPMREED